jgi:hypothetical protein
LLECLRWLRSVGQYLIWCSQRGQRHTRYFMPSDVCSSPWTMQRYWTSLTHRSMQHIFMSMLSLLTAPSLCHLHMLAFTPPDVPQFAGSLWVAIYIILFLRVSEHSCMQQSVMCEHLWQSGGSQSMLTHNGCSLACRVIATMVLTNCLTATMAICPCVLFVYNRECNHACIPHSCMPPCPLSTSLLIFLTLHFWKYRVSSIKLWLCLFWYIYINCLIFKIFATRRLNHEIHVKTWVPTVDSRKCKLVENNIQN